MKAFSFQVSAINSTAPSRRPLQVLTTISKKARIAYHGFVPEDNRPHKIDSKDEDCSYFKLCGQEFWELITGDNEFYQRIVVPIDKEAKKRDDSFKETYAAKINEMTKDFSEQFLTEQWYISWEKIIDFVSKKNGTGNTQNEMEL